MSRYAENADKLAPCGSSNHSQALKQTFSTFAPKTIYFEGSEAYDLRISAGVASHNEGMRVFSKVLEKTSLSPGKHTREYADVVDKRKQDDRDRRLTVQYKRQQLNLSAARKSTNTANEVREGTTFSSGCADMLIDNEVIPVWSQCNLAQGTKLSYSI